MLQQAGLGVVLNKMLTQLNKIDGGKFNQSIERKHKEWYDKGGGDWDGEGDFNDIGYAMCLSDDERNLLSMNRSSRGSRGWTGLSETRQLV